MLRGLEGRRIALGAVGEGQDRLDAVRSRLAEEGAAVDILGADTDDEGWHGGRYAALVLVGGEEPAPKRDPRLTQLVREFLVSEKPVAAFGHAVDAVIEAGGAAGRTVAAGREARPVLESSGARIADSPVHTDGCLITATPSASVEDFAARVRDSLKTQLEETALDEMSGQSFPASDPPAITPSSVGHLTPDKRPEGRR